jgi:hypothetical protein
VARLAAESAEEQLRCLQKLRESSSAGEATPLLCEFLAKSGGTTDDVVVAAVLDVFRAHPNAGVRAAETLSSLLPHRCKLYRERDKIVVVRLRAYIVVTLSEIGVPSSALPSLFDTLGNVDGRMTSIEVAAAARAVRSLGAQGREFAPYLLAALSARLSEEEVSLERYDPRFPAREATTAQLEAVRALHSISSAGDADVVSTLREIVRRDVFDRRVVQEARRTLEQIGARQ